MHLAFLVQICDVCCPCFFNFVYEKTLVEYICSLGAFTQVCGFHLCDRILYRELYCIDWGHSTKCERSCLTCYCVLFLCADWVISRLKQRYKSLILKSNLFGGLKMSFSNRMAKFCFKLKWYLAVVHRYPSKFAEERRNTSKLKDSITIVGEPNLCWNSCFLLVSQIFGLVLLWGRSCESRLCVEVQVC